MAPDAVASYLDKVERAVAEGDPPADVVRFLESLLDGHDKALRKEIRDAYERGLDRAAVLETAFGEHYYQIDGLCAVVRAVREKYDVWDRPPPLPEGWSESHHRSEEAIRAVYWEEFLSAAEHFGGDLPHSIPQRGRPEDPIGLPDFVAAVLYMDGVRRQVALDGASAPYWQEEQAFGRAAAEVMPELRRRVRRVVKRGKSPAEWGWEPEEVLAAGHEDDFRYIQSPAEWMKDWEPDSLLQACARLMWEQARRYRQPPGPDHRESSAQTHRLRAGRIALSHTLYRRSALNSKTSADIVAALAEAASERKEALDADEEVGTMLELLACTLGLVEKIKEKTPSVEVVRQASAYAEKVLARRFHNNPAEDRSKRQDMIKHACGSAQWLTRASRPTEPGEGDTLNGYYVRRLRERLKDYIPPETHQPLV